MSVIRILKIRSDFGDKIVRECSEELDSLSMTKYKNINDLALSIISTIEAQMMEPEPQFYFN